MTHIEFIGVSGVGKSTIMNNLSKLDKYYDGSKGTALLRNQSNLISELIQLLPYSTWNHLAHIIWGVQKNIYYQNYIKYYPDFESVIVSIDEYADFDKNRVSDLLIKTAAEYQLGVTTVREDEHLVMDEGFCHRALSMASRTENFTIPTKKFLHATPLPKVLIHVSAPDEVINQRRRERGDQPYNLEYIDRNRNFIKKISEVATGLGTNVVKINNVGQIDNVIDEVVEDLLLLEK